MARLNAGHVTRTGGRDATLRHIRGKLSLAVGMPSAVARRGWRWAALTSLARLESGHTPSRNHPEYWGGLVPWIGIQDAREHHGQRIQDTFQKTNELGIANSSARVLPEGTVCLSRTASVGYVVVMARPMATSQDFVNWVCSDELEPEFLKYLLVAEGREGLLRYASGSVHPTIYFPEAKAFHICYPEPREQLRIVKECDSLRTETQRLAAIHQ
jgi:type I restriction enzyme S subunit